MELLGVRLQKLIDSKGVTAYVVAQETGISQATLSRILNKNTKPNLRNTKTLAEYFNVSVPFLLTGEDYNPAKDVKVNDAFEMEYVENNNSNSFIKLENGQYLMTMPLAEHNIQAGFLDNYQNIDYLQDLSKHSIIVDNPARGRYVAFRVKGDSMDSGKPDAILNNYIVATRELQRQHWKDKIRIKDFPYWVIYTTQATYPLLKEIVEHDTEKGTIKCHSLNDSPEYVDFEISMNDIKALFYVIDINRSVAKRDYY